MRRLPLIFATLLVAACGTKGPLTLPPKNLPAPTVKPAQPAPAPTASPETGATAAPADDSSKDPKGAAQ
jgi:predicted small lipoprotein YifL